MIKNTIVIYTIRNCFYCEKAKILLENKDLDFQMIDATNNPDIRLEIMEKSGGRKTLPQIFINDQHIGGFDDLKDLDDMGKLDNMML